jgi:hypothetical protein
MKEKLIIIIAYHERKADHYYRLSWKKSLSLLTPIMKEKLIIIIAYHERKANHNNHLSAKLFNKFFYRHPIPPRLKIAPFRVAKLSSTFLSIIKETTSCRSDAQSPSDLFRSFNLDSQFSPCFNRSLSISSLSEEKFKQNRKRFFSTPAFFLETPYRTV